MNLRILKLKSPPEVIDGEFATEKIEFEIEWAGQDAGGLFHAYKFGGNRLIVWPDRTVLLDGKKLELVKAWEIVP